MGRTNRTSTIQSQWTLHPFAQQQESVGTVHEQRKWEVGYHSVSRETRGNEEKDSRIETHKVCTIECILTVFVCNLLTDDTEES